MSLYSIGFIKAFEQAMASDGRPAPVDWVEGGYLFIVPPDSVANLERNVKRQRAEGCVVDLLTPQELKSKFPSMNVDDLGAGAHTPHDGWCDPNGLLWGFRRKAVELGAVYVKDRVVAAEVDGGSARAVVLASGERVAADAFVNAAGAWAGVVAAMFGMKLPVTPMRRFEHYFTAGSPVERLPYVKDVARLAFRSEGKGFSGGLVDGDERRGFNFEVDHDYFERVVWPAVAHRFPAFEAAKCHRTWSGLYEQNELDGNPVIGAWSRVPNLYTVAGFSGHGMMHAPAAGRGIAEWWCMEGLGVLISPGSATSGWRRMSLIGGVSERKRESIRWVLAESCGRTTLGPRFRGDDGHGGGVPVLRTRRLPRAQPLRHSRESGNPCCDRQIQNGSPPSRG